MSAMVALLRGINVGGPSRRLPMADLRRVVEDLGHGSVSTYIQSGNVVFDGGDRRPADVAAELHDALLDTTGIDTRVAVRTLAEMEAAVAANPFVDRTDDPTRLHVAFHLTPGVTPDLGWYDPDTYAPEELATADGCTYLHLPGGMGRSRLATELGKRGRGADDGTVRNWRTVVKLTEMARAIDPGAT